MKFLRFLLLVFVFCLLPSAFGQKITTSITITNATTNGMTFAYNGSVRTFTNNPVNTATMVLTNSDVTGNGSKTNLLTQIYGNMFAQTTVADTGSNSFNIVANANVGVSFSMSAGLGTVSYSTQAVSGTIILQGPVSALPTAQARTNNASAIVGATAAPENTNSIPQSSIAASQLVGLANSQTISGAKNFTNAAGVWSGVIYQTSDSTNTIRGGYVSNVVVDSSVFTNSNLHGNSVFGNSANTSIDASGRLDLGGGNATLEVDGSGTLSGGSISWDTTGNMSAASLSAISAVLSGGFSPKGLTTNQTWIGTNTFGPNSDIAFTRKSISSLANGPNSGIVVGTNVFCELSGPTGGFNTAGFAGGRDGKLIILLNRTGFAWTNLNDSGTEAVPANRILTLTGSDLILTNATVTMIYDGVAAHWIVVSHNP